MSRSSEKVSAPVGFFVLICFLLANPVPRVLTVVTSLLDLVRWWTWVVGKDGCSMGLKDWFCEVCCSRCCEINEGLFEPKVWAEFNLRSVRWVLGDGGAWIAGMFEGAREEKLSFVGEAIVEDIGYTSRCRHNWRRQDSLV